MINSTLRYIAGCALVATAGIAAAAIPDGYYNSLEGKSGVTLKKAVKAAAKNHTTIAYGDDTWEVFLESDTHTVGGQRVWWDMYSNNNVAAPNSSSHGGLNIEHSVANSWWGGTKNDAYKDIHHLNPSNSEANNRKSNYPLGIVKTQTWSNNVTTVGKPASGTCGGAPYVYEPCDEYKGDFARVFFYMFTIYDDIAWSNQSDRNFMYNKSSDLTLQPWAYEMLLEWSKNDPVSQKEIDRNNAVYKHQKNRNPFIDYPELAEHIWGSKKNSPFHLDGTVEPDPDPTPNPTPGPDPNPDNKDLPSGYWYAVTSSADLNETDYYVIVATDNSTAMSYTAGGTFMQITGKAPTMDKTVAPARLTAVPDDAAVITLTKSGAAWMMTVSDPKGNVKGYLNSTGTKNTTVQTTGTPALITVKESQTDIQLGDHKGTLQYNSSAPRFTTYTSNQVPVMMYRLEADKQGSITSIEGTGIDETADETIYGIYDINGRKMPTESISELENGIYIVISNFGTKKILK